MRMCAEQKPKNCNHCKFRQNMSKHWDLEDICKLNKKVTSKIVMEKDCPLPEWEVMKIEESATM